MNKHFRDSTLAGALLGCMVNMCTSQTYNPILDTAALVAINRI